MIKDGGGFLFISLCVISCILFKLQIIITMHVGLVKTQVLGQGEERITFTLELQFQIFF